MIPQRRFIEAAVTAAAAAVVAAAADIELFLPLTMVLLMRLEMLMQLGCC